VAWLLLIAIGLLLSPLIAINNDIRFAAPFILQLYFFSTPILYKIENLPPFIQKLELFNPMALVVNGFQSVFSGGETITTSCVLAGTVTTGVVFFLGFLFFQSKVRNLAELL
jgi:ABC-type polysaccharide/polyol phosphate export permease